MAPHAKDEEQRGRQDQTEEGAPDTDQDRHQQRERGHDEVIHEMRADSTDGQASRRSGTRRRRATAPS